MHISTSHDAQAILQERFARDTLVALATVDEHGKPWVRTVDAYYENGSFYVITYLTSNKMRQIELNASIALCGDWFTAHGTAENMGHILLPQNSMLADKLRRIFAQWYENGHMDEKDPNTVILRIRLTDGILLSHGTRYDLEF